MTKNEIQFLIESGFTLSEVIAMGTAQSAAADPVEPERTEPEPEHEEAAEPVEPDKTAEALSQAIADLQKTVDKLGARIAAQGVKVTTSEAQGPESIDSQLAKIAKKINGG